MRLGGVRRSQNFELQRTHSTVIDFHHEPRGFLDSDTDSNGDQVQVPNWATGAAHEEALRRQKIAGNPDPFAGSVRAVNLNEYFGQNTHRMHVRTSSINWRRHGDALTRAEIDEDIAARTECMPALSALSALSAQVGVGRVAHYGGSGCESDVIGI